jgi:hypothetical protein
MDLMLVEVLVALCTTVREQCFTSKGVQKKEEKIFWVKVAGPARTSRQSI